MKADWLGVHEALEVVLGGVGRLGSESVPILECLQRVLAEEIVSPIDLPPWRNSGMDGFAIRAADVRGATEGRPVVLPISQEIHAGAFPSGPLAKGTAARIMTGAPVPEGADSVVRVEDTDGGREAGGTGPVAIRGDRDAGRNIRKKGEDIEAGDVALERGTWMDPGAIGLAASLGRPRLEVVRRPRVALLTSGDELVDIEGFDQVLAGRKIVSSNTYTLAAQLSAAGCEVHHLGIAPDSIDGIVAALMAARGCDALITSAGISVGDHDHVRTALLDLGLDVAFWRVRVRPGSPFAFGHIRDLGGLPWFGLPGNPVSSMVTFEVFARPALLRMAGRPAVFRRTVTAVANEDHPSQRGLTHFLRVRLVSDGDLPPRATLTGPQGSGILRSMASADGLLVVSDQLDGCRAGEAYPVIPLANGEMTPVAGF